MRDLLPESVWSTPKVPEHVARHIRRVVDGCIRRMGKNLATLVGNRKDEEGAMTSYEFMLNFNLPQRDGEPEKNIWMPCTRRDAATPQ